VFVLGAVYPLGMVVLFVISIFTYIEADVKKTTTGFPPHTFLLPVKTETLVGIPMLLGLIAAPATYVVWVYLVYRPVGIDLAIWWPALLIAAGMSSFQAVVWTLGGHPVLRLIAFVSVTAALFYLGIAASGIWDTTFPVKPAIAVGLPLLIVAANRLAVFGVARYRCGEWPKPRSKAQLDAVLPGETLQGFPKFSSATRAQFWFEWRQFGFLIPLYSGTIVAVLFLAILSGDLERSEFVQFLLMMIVLPVGMATLAGPTFASSSLWSRGGDLTQFGATRPMSDTALAYAKLQALGASTLSAWVLISVAAPLWVSLSTHRQLVDDMWQALVSQFGSDRVIAGSTLVALTLILLSWLLGALGMTLALTGRRELLILTSTVSFVVVLGGLIGCVWVYQHPEVLTEVLRWAKRLEWIVLVAGLGLGATALIGARQMRLLAGRTSGIALLITAGLVAVSTPLAMEAAPVNWHHVVAATTFLLVLGLIPIAAAPMALYLNRHR